jgi:hypothetical protein
MQVVLLKSKIHRATVTGGDVNYELRDLRPGEGEKVETAHDYARPRKQDYQPARGLRHLRFTIYDLRGVRVLRRRA